MSEAGNLINCKLQKPTWLSTLFLAHLLAICAYPKLGYAEDFQASIQLNPTLGFNPTSGLYQPAMNQMLGIDLSPYSNADLAMYNGAHFGIGVRLDNTLKALHQNGLNLSLPDVSQANLAQTTYSHIELGTTWHAQGPSNKLNTRETFDSKALYISWYPKSDISFSGAYIHVNQLQQAQQIWSISGQWDY